jgi:hypothetical protein
MRRPLAAMQRTAALAATTPRTAWCLMRRAPTTRRKGRRLRWRRRRRRRGRRRRRPMKRQRLRWRGRERSRRRKSMKRRWPPAPRQVQGRRMQVLGLRLLRRMQQQPPSARS